MSEITTEQKLKLVQQVRSRYDENRYDLSNRERLLYGRTSLTPDSREQYAAEPGSGSRSMRGDYGYDGGYGESLPYGERTVSFFRLRFLLAALLLAAVIVMDKNGIDVAGITSEKIYEMISADYEEKIELWVEAMSR